MSFSHVCSHSHVFLTCISIIYISLSLPYSHIYIYSTQRRPCPIFLSFQHSAAVCIPLYTLSGGLNFWQTLGAQLRYVLHGRRCFWNCSFTSSCYAQCLPMKYIIWSKNRCLWSQLGDLLTFQKRGQQDFTPNYMLFYIVSIFNLRSL